MFEIKNASRGFEVLHNDKKVIGNIALEIVTNGEAISFFPITYKNGIAIYENNEYLDYANITFKNENDAISVGLDIKLKQKAFLPIRQFDENGGIKLKLDFEYINALVSKYMESRFWSYVNIGQNNDRNIKDKTQSMLVKIGETHFALTTLCTQDFKAQMRNHDNTIELYLTSECGGISSVKGEIFCLAASKTPYGAVRKSVEFASHCENFITPIPQKEEYPEIFKYLGWCTWDAFYHDVTAEKIEEKLREFKDKNIPLGWVLIDDGWFEFEGSYIKTLKEDKIKFPEGLKNFIARIKKEYGIKYVGVWHSFCAYWLGIKEGSEAHIEMEDCLIKTNAGIITPDYNDFNKVHKFYDIWHKYLKDCGVDFLKIDTQGTLGYFTQNNASIVKATRTVQEAIEKSVHENFNNNLINCMSMNMENIQSRRYTKLLRNSDDFYPNKENGFLKHIIQNAYNSIFNRDMYFADFDMWWTNHESAINNAVLRAVSGGPVYVSDKIGNSDGSVLIPLCDNNGKLIMCDDNAVPTPDCVYKDPIKTDKIIKLMNRAGEVSIVAIFNLDMSVNEKIIKISWDDIYTNNSDEYIACLYFEKKFIKITNGDEIKIRIRKNESEIINFYPVKYGKIMLGDIGKYINGAHLIKATAVADVLKDQGCY